MTAFTLARPRCATSTRVLILRIFDHFFLLYSIIDGCNNRLRENNGRIYPIPESMALASDYQLEIPLFITC